MAAILVGAVLGVTGRELPRGFVAERMIDTLSGVVFLSAYFRVIVRAASGRLRGSGGSQPAAS